MLVHTLAVYDGVAVHSVVDNWIGREETVLDEHALYTSDYKLFQNVPRGFHLSHQEKMSNDFMKKVIYCVGDL